jgi:hypothetical protein
VEIAPLRHIHAGVALPQLVCGAGAREPYLAKPARVNYIFSGRDFRHPGRLRDCAETGSILAAIQTYKRDVRCDATFIQCGPGRLCFNRCGGRL